ncbi:pseudaminic acid synthase [Planctobacterium marinum]|uniref:Pseudaminic acid synthase n=1 Tax=Planctobacterium marinum TaxID=1631968 RepID=A0AA48HQG9_9ALTE|nr:pseudaminic acid synthase [Planctobacterium marinum]
MARQFEQQFKIGEFPIGNGRPFIIAELSGNHDQNFELAIAMIDAAAEAGVDAIKLQTYTADSMTLDSDAADFVIGESDSLWAGEKLHSLYQKAATPYEWHKPLFEHARKRGLVAFSSPFDEAAVEFLDELDVPCFKIASFELTDLPLIACAAAKRKPLIMSTGMASVEEIEEAVATAYEHGCKQLVLLKCTSTYPAAPTNTHLNTIPDLRNRFGCIVGLSDHTRGIGAAVSSVALGAKVIEKHFVLDRSAGGVDAAFSLEPAEFKMLVEESKIAWQALGQVQYGGSEAEQKSKKYRRSVYVSADIKAGEVFTRSNLKVVRPALGLAPKHYHELLGKVAACDLKLGQAMSWEHVVAK